MLVPFFDLSAHVRAFRSEIHSKLDEVIDDGYFIGGQALDNFESEFSSYIGIRKSIGVGNGLDALRLVLEGWGIGPGDEVIVPGFSFYATWLAVMQVGATPVFVDVESRSANLNPELLEAALSSRTKAVIVVHLFGWPAQMAPILKFASDHGLKVLEDTAQAHGASVDGDMVGSIGDAAAFSFYPTKNLGALGDGGAVTTNDESLASLVISRRSYGVGATKYEHKDLGWNSRLDSIQAGFLSLGLLRLETWNATRKNIASRYHAALGGSASNVVGPQDVQESVWHHFVIRSKNRDRVREFLYSKGVSTDIHYPYFAGSVSPVETYLQKLGLETPSQLSVSQRLSEEVLSLPIGPWMSGEQTEFVAKALGDLPPSMLSD